MSEITQPVTHVTPGQIAAAIVDAQYYVFPGTTVTVCLLTLRNGAKAIGYNYGAIDPSRQDWEQGRQSAYDMAREKVWELEGYALRERLAGETAVRAIAHLELDNLPPEQVEELKQALKDAEPGVLHPAPTPFLSDMALVNALADDPNRTIGVSPAEWGQELLRRLMLNHEEEA